MRVVIRSAGVVFVGIVAAVLLALTTATSALADTALMVGGLAATNLPDSVMSRVLTGRFAGTNWNRVNVDWPGQARPYTGPNDLTLGQSVVAGTTELNRLLGKTNGRVTVVGMSAGALVVDEVLRGLANNPAAPDKDDLTVVIIADSSRQQFIDRSQYNPTLDYTYQPPPETKYDIIVVTGEYDGFADFPDRPWNFVAVINALVGAFFVHVPVMFADLSKVPVENITATVNSKGGETKSYLVPAEHLPLVQLFPSLAPMEASLKQQVDAGYSRNDQAAVTRSTAIDLTTETDVESRTLTVDPPVGSLTEPVEAPAQSRQGPADATDVLAEPTAEAPAQTDEGLNTAPEAVSNRVTDLTDGNKVSPSTSAGTTQSSSGRKPGDGFRAAVDAMSQLLSGKPASTSTTTAAPTSDTSTNTGSETSPSTSSSPGSGSTP